MEYNFLSPNCGLKVSAICLGAMTFQKTDKDTFLKGATVRGEEGAYEIMDKFVELGGNFIDTANIYSHGQSEEIVGQWMSKRGNRDDMVIATKCRANMKPSSPNCAGLSRKHILEAVDASLKRLQTDYIDLYQIHGPDPATPMAETIRTLDDLVRSGKVRYVGACNLAGWEMQRMVDLSDKLGCNPFVTLQSCYNLVVRYSEPEAFTVCKNEGLGVLPWGALRGGLLTGKLKRGDKAPEGSRMEQGTKSKISKTFDNVPDVDAVQQDEKFWAIMDSVEKIAKVHGKTPGQVAIRWLLQTAPVTSVIAGTTKIHQLEDNMGAAGWRLTDEEMKELNEVSEPEWRYPENMRSMFTQTREKARPIV